MPYIRPVPFTHISSWTDHTNRSTPSQEPGTDYYCPIGTPLVAAGAGVVADLGGSVQPATGRYITIDLDDGRRVRYLHLSKVFVQHGWRVDRGSVIGESGASGYGSDYFGAQGMHDFPWGETGGPHVHMSLWRSQRYSFGRYATLDPELYMNETPMAGAGGGSIPFDPQEDDMPSEEWLNGLGSSIVEQVVAQTFSGKDRERLDAVYAALFGPANLNVPQMTWAKPFGEAPGAAQYGLLDVSIHSQALIAQQAGRLAAIEEVVEQLAVGAGAVLDMGAIADAAERGAERALEGLAVPTAAEVADAVNDDAADRLKG